MTTKYKNLVAMLATHDWALMSCYMDVLSEVANLRSAGKEWTPEEISERIAEHNAQFPWTGNRLDRELAGGTPEQVYGDDYGGKPSKPYAMREGIAIVPLEGVLLPKASYYQQISGAGSMEIFAKRMHFAGEDGDAKSILIDVGSPGGSALGVSEAQRSVIEAKAKKPVHAYVRDMMCSGAYWIGCAADEIHIPESSVGGSIGVYQMHVDRSKQDAMLGESWSYVSAGPRKVDGNPHEPLKGAARQAIQSRVDHIYANFLATVSEHRKLKSDDLVKATGGGDYFYGKLCLAMGLCDTNLHFEQVIARMKGTKTSVSFARVDAVANAGGSLNAEIAEKTPEQASVSREPLKSVEGTQSKETSMPATRGEEQVDKDLKLLLYSLNIVKSMEASDEAARAAVEAWAMAAGVTLPEGDDKIKAYFVERARAGLTAKPQATESTESKTQLDEAAIEARANKRRKELIAAAALLGESGTKVTAEQIEEAIDKKIDPRDAVYSWATKPRLKPEDGRRLDVKVTQDAGDALSTPVSEAIGILVGGVSAGQEISDQGRYLASQGISQIAKAVCQSVGRNRLSPEDEAKTFLRLCGGSKDEPIRIFQPLTQAEQAAGLSVAAAQPAYTPGTLPVVFAAPMRQRIMKALASAPVTYQKIGHRDEDADDFDGTELKFHSAKSELPERVDGHPRTQRKQMAVRPAFWKVKEFGDTIPLTWQTVVSGKLQQFNNLLTDSQWAAERTINRFAVEGVVNDPVMFDSYNLFQTANQTSGGVTVRYKNAIAGGSGGTVNIAQMTIMDDFMVAHKDFDNESSIPQQPKIVWIPKAHRIAARQFQKFTEGAQNQAATAPSSMSVWPNLDIAYEPMLDDYDANKWYTFADPAICAVVWYQFLQGHGPGGVWEMWYDPETSSIVYAIRSVFGVAIARWHGVARNSGGV